MDTSEAETQLGFESEEDSEMSDGAVSVYI